MGAGNDADGNIRDGRRAVHDPGGLGAGVVVEEKSPQATPDVLADSVCGADHADRGVSRVLALPVSARRDRRHDAGHADGPLDQTVEERAGMAWAGAGGGGGDAWR